MVALIDNTDAETIGEICKQRGRRPDELLEILHAVQARLGFISKDTMRVIAGQLNVSQADVYGVVTFYHDFRRVPPGETIVKICRAEACQAVGSEALAAHVEARLGVKTGGKNADGDYSLGDAYCLGNCALGPAVMIDDALYGRVSNERFDILLSQHSTNDASDA